MSEKTEKATAYKLQKSKEKGQVSKSTELTTILSLLVLLGLITALWPRVTLELKALITQLLSNASKTQLNIDNLTHLYQFILNKLAIIWLPFALAGGLAIILGTIAQTGIVWTSAPLKPDFKRLAPSQGWKKLCSIKTCFEAAKSILKLGLASLLLFFALKRELPAILQLELTPAPQNSFLMMHILLRVLFQLLLVLSVLAIFDKLYSQWNYNKNNRMSKQEVKEEHKQRDGCPKIKAKIKQLQFQLRQKTASLKQVPTADVLITNPYHLAIALKYDSIAMPAPKVICKVRGDLVQQVKAIARKHNIPIIENKLFARALYDSVALNQCIKSELYPIAAGIFRAIYKQRMPA